MKNGIGSNVARKREPIKNANIFKKNRALEENVIVMHIANAIQ